MSEDTRGVIRNRKSKNTDNIMDNRERTKRQTMIYIILHTTLNIEYLAPHNKGD